MHKHIAYILLLLILPAAVLSDCNTCSTDKQACISQNKYQYCNAAGVPGGTVMECNAGAKCDINAKCTADLPDALLGCNECNVCNSDKTFACLTTKTFALCLGEDQPSSIEGTCAEDTYCNKDDRHICGVGPPSCVLALDPTAAPTAPSPSANPKDFCEFINKEGRYPVGVDPDSTCKQYLRCINSNGVWYSATYVCPSGTYFDDKNSNCNKDLPQRCSGTVAHIQVNSLRLN